MHSPSCKPVSDASFRISHSESLCCLNIKQLLQPKCSSFDPYFCFHPFQVFTYLNWESEDRGCRTVCCTDCEKNLRNSGEHRHDWLDMILSVVFLCHAHPTSADMWEYITAKRKAKICISQWRKDYIYSYKTHRFMNQSADMRYICLHVAIPWRKPQAFPSEPSLSIQEINNHTQNMKCNSVKTSTLNWQELP